MTLGDWLQTGTHASKKDGKLVYGLWSILTGEVAVRKFGDENWEAIGIVTDLGRACNMVVEYALHN